MNFSFDCPQLSRYTGVAHTGHECASGLLDKMKYAIVIFLPVVLKETELNTNVQYMCLLVCFFTRCIQIWN